VIGSRLDLLRTAQCGSAGCESCSHAWMKTTNRSLNRCEYLCEGNARVSGTADAEENSRAAHRDGLFLFIVILGLNLLLLLGWLLSRSGCGRRFSLVKLSIRVFLLVRQALPDLGHLQ
jgi:hypothetical protein